MSNGDEKPAGMNGVDDNKKIDMQRKVREWREKKDKVFKQYDTTFRILTGLFIITGITICVYNIPTFRQYATQKGVFIVPLSSLWWCIVGFAFHFAGRKFFFKLTSEYFKKRLHPKNQYYNEQEKKDKLIIIVKQTYEGIFHLGSTLISFWLFREQNWFPQVAGGCGSCDRIFEIYPQWPVNNRTQLLNFYLFQLGTYIFLILDLMVFDRQRYETKNFGQLFYHHFVTILLIFFSLFYNLVPIGITVLFVHDCSDFLRGFTRTVGESRFCLLYPKFTTYFNYIYFVLWVIARLLIFPFCLIDSMYNNHPSHLPEWEFLWMQCIYLIVISCGMYSIQCYWSYFVFLRMQQEKEKNEQWIKWQEQKIKIGQKGEIKEENGDKKKK